jgi:hypothetical protein
VQVHPIKPVLKARGSTLLKVKCVGPLHNVAFNVSLRRYTKAIQVDAAGVKAGAYTRPLISST